MAEQRSLLDPPLCDYQPPGPPGALTSCVRDAGHDGLHVCASIRGRVCELVELTPLAAGNAQARTLIHADLKPGPFDRHDAAVLYAMLDGIRAYRRGQHAN